MFGSRTAFVNADSNGGTDIEIVAAVTDHLIVVDLLVISGSAAATDVFLESGTGTVIFPKVYIPAGDSIVVDEPFLKTAKSESLTFSATITGTISVFVKYHLEPTYS